MPTIPVLNTNKVQYSVTGLISLFSSLFPILIVFFFLMLSAMNQNFKGLILMAGLCIALLINTIIATIVGSIRVDDASIACNLIDIPYLNNYDNPSNASMVITFIFTYLVLPMIYNNQPNYVVIILLSIFLLVDTIFRYTHKCTTPVGSFFGIIIGFIAGFLWFNIFREVGADDLLYFNELESNSVRCQKPKKQTFKCSVYKNGVLVSQNIA